MKNIVILDDGGDLSVFENAEAALLYMEPQDVASGAYILYSADGQEFLLSTSNGKTTATLPMATQIELTRSGEALAKKMARFLNAIGTPEGDMPSLTFRELLPLLVARIGYTV